MILAGRSARTYTLMTKKSKETISFTSLWTLDFGWTVFWTFYCVILWDRGVGSKLVEKRLFFAVFPDHNEAKFLRV